MLAGLCLLVGIACTKQQSDGTDEDPTPPDTSLGITATKVTEITIMGTTNNLDQLLLVYNSKTIRFFDLRSDGDATITFHGKDGRSLLGEYIGTTNLANFKILNGDTVRIIYRQDTTNLITDVGDTYNSGIRFTARYGEAKDSSIKRFESFVKALPGKKWKASPLSP